MIRFAELVEALLLTPARNTKLRLLEDYFRNSPDPARGWALAALTGTLAFAEARPAQIRALAAERMDPALFAWSHDFVGDLAETVALAWPERHGANRVPELAEIVEALAAARPGAVGGLLAPWLDALDPTGRWALLKLVTGGLRVGVSARLARAALAGLGPIPLEAIEEVWPALAPPYGPLFAWIEGRGPRPDTADRPSFLPLMLASTLEPGELDALAPADYLAEWKWDGLRVQLSGRGGERRIYSRGGDDISSGFPEIAAVLPEAAVLDGELLVGSFEAVAPFDRLQQRLDRKRPSAALLRQCPAFVRLYDALWLAGEDLRGLPLAQRRARLEAWHRAAPRPRLDLSPLIPFAGWPDLAALRDGDRAQGTEGLMLKRADSPYLAGRPRGPWLKWKRGALTLDCVLMYAQRSQGQRGAYYSDCTFGAWRGDQLVPVGKACAGFTDEELTLLDRWVRGHTRAKYGPVRDVEPALVIEIAFDGVQRSTRHKSGLVLRFPRVHRLRWDKPAAEADRVETLEAMLPG